MATSGTTTFNLDIADVIEEAMAMLGGEQTLGFEPLEARRTLNLLLIDWMNRGILLWKLIKELQTRHKQVDQHSMLLTD